MSNQIVKALWHSLHPMQLLHRIPDRHPPNTSAYMMYTQEQQGLSLYCQQGMGFAAAVWRLSLIPAGQNLAWPCLREDRPAYWQCWRHGANFRCALGCPCLPSAAEPAMGHSKLSCCIVVPATLLTNETSLCLLDGGLAEHCLACHQS